MVEEQHPRRASIRAPLAIVATRPHDQVRLAITIEIIERVHGHTEHVAVAQRTLEPARAVRDLARLTNRAIGVQKQDVEGPPVGPPGVVTGSPRGDRRNAVTPEIPQIRQ